MLGYVCGEKRVGRALEKLWKCHVCECLPELSCDASAGQAWLICSPIMCHCSVQCATGQTPQCALHITPSNNELVISTTFLVLPQVSKEQRHYAKEVAPRHYRMCFKFHLTIMHKVSVFWLSAIEICIAARRSSKRSMAAEGRLGGCSKRFSVCLPPRQQKIVAH